MHFNNLYIHLRKVPELFEFHATYRCNAYSLGVEGQRTNDQGEETLVWKTGLLDESELSTVKFMNELHFALCSGNKHQDCHFPPCHVPSQELRIYPGGLKGDE